MGVPVVSYAGDRFVRISASYLSSVNLEGLIAKDIPSYVELAQRAVKDIPRLARVRAGLRNHDEIAADECVPVRGELCRRAEHDVALPRSGYPAAHRRRRTNVLTEAENPPEIGVIVRPGLEVRRHRNALGILERFFLEESRT